MAHFPFLLISLIVIILFQYITAIENIHYKQMNEQNTKHSWEHLVGIDGNQAKEQITKENPGMNVFVIPHVRNFCHL
jgi:hypothetical protein